MPHDKKGRLVEVGDFVRVKPFNTPQEVIGRVSYVNAETEACNARVIWPLIEGQRFIGRDLVNGSQPREYTATKEDYTECRALEVLLKADGSEPKDEAPLTTDPVAQVENVAQDFAAPVSVPQADGGFGRIGAILAAGLLALAALAAPALAQDAGPAPAPQVTVKSANAASFGVTSQVGAMVVTTTDSGTGLTPMMSIDAEGPLAFGEGFSLGRIGARIGLTSSPGQAFDGSDPTNYKGVEISLRLGRVIGVRGDIRTLVLAEYGFTTLIKGSNQARPRDGLVHSFGVGLAFESKDASSQLVIEPGFDEATTRCSLPIVCTGLHSGFALLIYGQVPILDGKVQFGGDVSIAGTGSVEGVTRNSVERVFVVADPVRVIKGAQPSPGAPTRSAALEAADRIRRAASRR